MKIYKFVPEDVRDLADLEVGSLVDLNGKLHVLIGVDPWSGYVVRYTWFNELCDRLGYWIADKTGRGYRGMVGRSHLVRHKESTSAA